MIDRSRIDQMNARFNAILSPSHGDQTAEEIMRGRTRELATRLQGGSEEQTARSRALIVRRGRWSLGLPLDRVSEVAEIVWTPLPASTEVVRGLFQIRGRCFCMVDVLPLIDKPGEAPNASDDDSTAALVALIHTDGRDPLGLLIDSIVGVRDIYGVECDADRLERQIDFVSDVTTDLVSILDIEALLARKQLRVNTTF